MKSITRSSFNLQGVTIVKNAVTRIIARVCRCRPFMGGALLSVAVVSAMSTPAASAQTPVHFEFPTSGAATFDHCSFPVSVSLSGQITGVGIPGKNGAPTRLHIHVVQQDTFTANGKTLIGAPYSFHVEVELDSGFNETANIADGVAEKVFLPDGGVFITSGRIDFYANGLPVIFIPVVGATVNLEAFCAALS
jgi:hypothetical protein